MLCLLRPVAHSRHISGASPYPEADTLGKHEAEPDQQQAHQDEQEHEAATARLIVPGELVGAHGSMLLSAANPEFRVLSVPQRKTMKRTHLQTPQMKMPTRKINKGFSITANPLM
jgi:hypothetical protein